MDETLMTVSIPLSRYEQLHRYEIAFNNLQSFLKTQCAKKRNKEMMEKYGSFSIELEDIYAALGIYKEA